ncbi:MAG: DUF4476 domain-containing protein [Bacteroidia bacterium]
MRFQILMALFLFPFSFFSQDNANTTITSKSNLPMLLLVNDVVQSTETSDTIHAIFSHGSYNLKIIYADSLKYIEKNIFVSTEEHTHYEFFKQDSTVNLRLVGQYFGETRDENFVSHQPSSSNSYEQLVSLLKDEPFVKKLFTGATDYQGKRGCESPNYINKYELISKINGAFLTKQKTQLIEKTFDSKCLKVSDVFDVLKAIDYEDVRLELLQKYKTSIFDLDNINNLSALFAIKQHQEAFNNLKKQL